MFYLAENTDTFRNGVFVYVAYKGIFDEPEFLSNYFPALVREKDNDFFIFAYYNKDFLAQLDKNKYDIAFLQRRYRRKEK